MYKIVFKFKCIHGCWLKQLVSPSLNTTSLVHVRALRYVEYRDGWPAMQCCLGNVLGVTLDAGRLMAMFRKVRRAGLISEFVSISPNHKHRLIHIACDGGRVCRSECSSLHLYMSTSFCSLLSPSSSLSSFCLPYHCYGGWHPVDHLGCFPSMSLWHCWLGDRKGIQPVNTGCWFVGGDLLTYPIAPFDTSYSSSCHHHLHHP